MRYRRLLRACASAPATGVRPAPVKDTKAKTHPCLRPFNELPPHQQAKDHLFRGIVHSLRPFIEES